MVAVARRAREAHGVDARVRVGIHTGLVVVSDIGTGAAVEKDAIVGVTPNLAARIQAAAEPGMVAISDVTERIVEDDFTLEPLGGFNLKGITREVHLFRVLDVRHQADRLRSRRFEGLIVGRAGASEGLLDKWESTVAGTAVPATLLLGEAGIGKSRLVADFRLSVESSKGALFELGCLPYYANSSLWPVGRALQNHLGIKTIDDAGARTAALLDKLKSLGMNLDATVPLLAPLVGVDAAPGYPAPQLDPTAMLKATLGALVGFITAMAPHTPTAVVVEDLHWADPSTLELVGMLATDPPPDTMFVGTSRTELEAAWVADAEIVTLGHLDDQQAGELVDLLSADNDLDDRVRQSIVQRAGGIPLFIEELVRSALAPTSGAFPMRLQEVLTARLKAPGVDLDLAQAAATDGVEFDSSVLAEIVGDPTRLETRLATLEDAEIIERIDDPSGSRYRFRHALLRDAAYETQVLEARRAVHGRIATVLGARGGDAAVIAEHYDRAGDVLAALMQYGVAVQAAQSSGAHAEAIQLATRSLELISELPEGTERDTAELGTLMYRGLSSSSISGYAAPEVGADFRRANELSEKLGTRPEVMPAALAIWSFSLVNGDIPTAKLLVERLRGRVEDGSGAWFGPEVDAALGYQSLYEGNLGEAQVSFEKSIAGFSGRPDGNQVSEYWPLPNDPIAVTQVGLAVCQILRGDVDGGAATARQAIARAESVPFPQGPFSLAFVKVYLAWIALVLGDRERSQRLGEETSAIAAQYGYAYWAALGSIYHRVVDADIATFQQAIATLRLIGHEAFHASYLAYLADLQCDGGSPADALETIHDAMLVIGKSGEMLHLPDVLRLRAKYSIRFGDEPADAVADLTRSLELSVAQGNAVYGLKAAIEIAMLEPELRPAKWRESLEGQVALFISSEGHEDLRVARRILGGV